jgi:hypothetical protein
MCRHRELNFSSAESVRMFEAFQELLKMIGERLCKIVMSRERLSNGCSDSQIADVDVNLF